MKLLIKGGKIINKGYKGAVMELYNNDNDDKETLYNNLSKANPRKIKLIGIDKSIKVNKTQLNDILDLIKKNESSTLAKKFLFRSFFFGSNKNNFINELNGYKSLIKIFKNDISKYTTVKKGFTFNNTDIYGIHFNNNYYIFLEKCYKTLENINFDAKLINKCIKDVFEILEILYNNNYIHNDIKPDNIILCNNRFKLIDWESSNYIKNQAYTFINSKNGNLVFNHPIKFYRIGIPYLIYKYIYDAEFITYKYLYNLKIPPIISSEVEKSFNNVIKYYKTNKNFYLKIADYYSFVITILYIAEKNNITHFNKNLINKVLSYYFFTTKI